MKKITLLLIIQVLLFSWAFAQTQKITGKITDDKGAAISGASVLEKGTKNGTTTNADGTFTLNVKKDAVLIVQGVGFETKTVKAEDGITLELAATTEVLNEVVVTAFGIKRTDRSLGYTVQTLDGSALTQASNSSFAGALQGKTSGVEIAPSSGMPGASIAMTIRGARSFTGNNAPLYVVDGMPIASTADMAVGGYGTAGSDYADRGLDIDPNDIASISILKGQTAAALYGINASNGAIVITTKSGSGLKGKARITFSTNANFDNLSRHPQLQSEYAQGSNGNYTPVTSLSWGPKISALPDDPKYGGNSQGHQGQYYVQQLATAGLSPWATPQAYNNVNAFFKTGQVYNNYLNIANGNDKNSYSLSLGSTNQTGIVPHTGMNKYTANLGAQSTLSDHFKAGFNGHFVNEDITKAPGANNGIMATVYPAPASYDLKGIPNHAAGDVYSVVNYRAGAYTNPYWVMEHNLFEEKTNRFYGNAYADYTTKFSPATSLDVKYQLGTDVYTTNYTDMYDYGDPTTLNGSITQTTFTKSTFNSLLTADFKWDINPDLNLDALVGNEYINSSSINRVQAGQSFAFAGWDNIQNATSILPPYELIGRTRNMGTFANLSLSWLRMLYLSLTGRYDVVSTMPPGHTGFFYPSASLGFVFTELGGLKNNRILNYGKLRFSYAEVGQAGQFFTPSYTPAGFEYGGGFYGFTPISYPINGQNAYVPNPTLYDPNLVPQNTKNYEIGADLGFFKDLIQVNYTFSRQNVKNQIFPVPLAGSTGYSSLMMNGGSIHTNAHELTLTVNAVRKTDWAWSIGANFTQIRNYVDALAPGVESIFLGGFTTPQVRASIGDQFPTIYGVSYQRNDKGQIEVDDNGDPIPGAPAVIGKGAPNFTLGINTSLRYKIFTLSAVLDWKSGGQMISGTTQLLDFYGMSKASGEARDRNSITVPNSVLADGVTPNTTPITGYNNIQYYYNVLSNIDEAAIVNSSFVKLRELVFGIQAIKKKNFGLNVNLYVRNLLLWTNAPQLDPESSQGNGANSNMTGVFERFSLPQTRSMGLGVSINL
ncbi:MAG: SusC/RagA family TonB-linked outer membrane protein [Chitinophagaceae bacterium]|jgi:TonB-linked SusC/RagA family outer membrane protein|nr:SusC/RagA family TonB-linked outer membrane protein [Chitinophagaceae bacterium]